MAVRYRLQLSSATNEYQIPWCNVTNYLLFIIYFIKCLLVFENRPHQFTKSRIDQFYIIKGGGCWTDGREWECEEIGRDGEGC